LEEVVSLLDRTDSEYFLNENGRVGWNALHVAIFCEYSEIVERLIERFVDVNKLTNDGWSPL
jgi:serum/glucocorticoid-regulated kinase 2